ncbi:MAG: cyclic nucleotide-binding/CBS domain-containing protein [Candidatus Hydrothermarchaeales archaeon]
MRELLVKDIMHKITVIDATSSVAEAAKIMAEKNIGSVMVRKSGDITGILTERDILKRGVAEGLDIKKVKVAEIMTEHPYIIDSEAAVEDASKVFVKYRIRRLPVIERGRIVGIITSRDVAKSIRYAYFRKVQHLRKRGGGPTR